MTQTLLTIFLPTLMVLVGILVNRNDASRIDGRISSLEGRLDGRVSALEAKLDSRITGLESRLHSDLMLVVGKLNELDVRIAKLEGQRQIS